MYNENVAVADMNGDGPEIIGPTDTHYITALDRNGSQLRANAMYSAGRCGARWACTSTTRGPARLRGVRHGAPPQLRDSAPVIADVNGDGVPSSLWWATSTTAAPIRTRASTTCRSSSASTARAGRQRLRLDGDPACRARSGPLSEDYNVIENAPPNAVVADLDGDGRKEILFPSYDGQLHAYWLDKTETEAGPTTCPAPASASPASRSSPTSTTTARPRSSSPRGRRRRAARVGQLHVLNSLGVQLFAIDLPASFPAGSWNGGLGAPTLANIDGDADLELVAGTAHPAWWPTTCRARPRARAVVDGPRQRQALRRGKPERDTAPGSLDVPPWNVLPVRERAGAELVTVGCALSRRSSARRRDHARGRWRCSCSVHGGPGYVPPACTTPMFADVPCSIPSRAGSTSWWCGT